MTDTNAIAPGTRRPNVGIYLPNWTGGTVAGQTPTWGELRSLAQVIEEVGFDSLWVADEFRSVFSEGDAIGYWESATILGAAAAHAADRAWPARGSGRLSQSGAHRAHGSSVGRDQRRARRAGHRSGYDELEHRAHGFAWDHRVSRLEEATSIIGQLLRSGQVDHHGQFFEMRDVVMEPRGPRPGGPPLMIGTLSIGPRLMRCVARFADGWNGWLAFDDNRPAAVRPHLAALDAACHEIGRDPATLRRSVGIAVATSDDAPFRYGPIDLSTIAVRGTTDEIAAVLRGFAAEGIDEVMIYAFPITHAAVEALAPVLAVGLSVALPIPLLPAYTPSGFTGFGDVLQHRLRLGVEIEGIDRLLAPVARLLEAAERDAGERHKRRVDADRARSNALRHAVAASAVGRPDRRRQAVADVVRHPHRLGLVAEPGQRDRSEHLFLEDPRVVGDPTDDGRRDERVGVQVAVEIDAAASARPHPRARGR